MFAKEKASITKFGFVVPVIVRETTTGYEIVDGEHRWRAAKALRLPSIPVWNLGAIPDSMAKQLTVALNEIKGDADPALLGSLLSDLLSEESKEDLLEALPFTQESLDRLLGLGGFDWGSLESGIPAPAAPAAERSESAWVERTFRLPVDAAGVLDEALGRVRAQEAPETVADWQALEYICAEFLSGQG